MTVIDCSTISESLVKEIASAVSGLGASFLDAPVTGGKPAAMDGTLVFMVGGDAAVIEAHADVFDTLGKSHPHGT